MKLVGSWKVLVLLVYSIALHKTIGVGFRTTWDAARA
jgi:hypothetical protein